MKTITLSIAGMTCQGCANTVTAALAGVEGVRRAHVSLEQKRARLVLENAGLVDALVAAAQRLPWPDGRLLPGSRSRASSEWARLHHARGRSGGAPTSI